MDERQEQLCILKWLLRQIERAEKKKKQLDQRLLRIVEERESPIGGAGYKPLPRSAGNGDGAASILFKMSDIEERIYKQKEEIDKAIVRVMDIIEYLPLDSVEREIMELRHIDGKPWGVIEKEIPMSRSQCNNRYNKALDMLLDNGRIQRMIKENEEEYLTWANNEAIRELAQGTLKNSSGGIASENKSGKKSRKKTRGAAKRS
jgi:hypothetical protein